MGAESAGRWVHRPTGVAVELCREQWIQKSFALDRVVGHTYWRVVLPSGEAKGRYRSKGDAIPFGETCVNRLDDRYAKTARAAAADSITETWLTLSQLLRTTDKDQHEPILAALDNPTVIGLHRRGPAGKRPPGPAGRCSSGAMVVVGRVGGLVRQAPSGAQGGVLR